MCLGLVRSGRGVAVECKLADEIATPPVVLLGASQFHVGGTYGRTRTFCTVPGGVTSEDPEAIPIISSPVI